MRKLIILVTLMLISTNAISSAHSNHQQHHKKIHYAPTKQSSIVVASWYGKWHHGHKTASGTIFDQRKLTAAHKTLPFGTKLRVTNLENNKSVLVEITDRGPMIIGRSIDLSMAAAKRIGILGIGKVKLEII